MRVLLNGQGGPIPKEALPDPTEDAVLPVQAFFLENGVPFLKQSYVDLGYTHFEVWCLGAAGGRGGGYFATRGSPGLQYRSYGGEGGGGGLHKVVGALADLPASCPVVVGVIGANGADSNGQDKENSFFDGSVVTYPPNPSYVAATNAQDGGASSFNGATCRASGGKGGLATPMYLTAKPPEATYAKYRAGGNGGRGGIGNQATAGGGGTGGSTVIPPSTGNINAFNAAQIHIEPTDGGWDGIVGAGGGGGRGGTYKRQWQFDAEILQEADNGGQGSYSFTDTTVYGARGLRANDTSWAVPTVPGGGGGARIRSVYNYGSKAADYNPNGAVYIRIFQVL